MGNIAIIELNDKELKLSIFKTSNGRFKKIEEKRQPFKLGEEITQEELLRPKTKTQLVEVLKIYRKMIETYKVTKIVAVASNILLKARNYHGFIEEVYNNTGISFVILSDEDAIKNIYASTINSIDNSKGYIIHIDSYVTYLIKYNRRTILGSEIIPLGAVNLLTAEDGNARTMQEMRNIMKEALKPLELVSTLEEDAALIGTGSSFISFGRIAKKIARYPLDIDNNYNVSADLMQQTVDFIKGIELDKIKKIKGIAEDDANCIASGLAIIQACYEVLHINDLTISTASTMEGIAHVTVSLPAQEKFNDLLANSLDSFYEFTKHEYSINTQVYGMALILFKQLKVMHKLPRYYVKPLRIAAFLYDSGKTINFDNYEKHGLETILYSGIMGASHRELLIAGFICLCQNLDSFSLADWMKFKDIVTDEDLDAVRKLGVIVKLADALNSSKKPIITDVICDILGDSIIMKTIVEGEATFEIMEGMKVASDYKKVFKKSLQII